jgi:hypothetical protein
MFHRKQVSEKGNPTAKGNCIRDGKASGVLVSDGGRGMFTGNSIVRNETDNVEVVSVSFLFGRLVCLWVSNMMCYCR